MSKENTKQIDGIEQWLHLIRRFGMSPHEALDTMKHHDQNIIEILHYLEAMLNDFKLNPMDREKLGKVKDLIKNEGRL